MNLESKKVKSRCAARISLSKHADYINSHLLYVLDDRETIIESELKAGDSKLCLLNNDFGDREIKVSNFPQALENKLDWSFYVIKLFQELQLESKLKNKTLTINVKSTIPAAGGLSSSHALLLSLLRNLSELFEIAEFNSVFKDPLQNKNQTFTLIKLCQKIEQARGFKSGLGDQCAQLFSKQGYLTGIKIFPDLEVNYIKIPQDISFLTIPSFIKADKSTPEFIEKNTNMEKYKTLNLLAKDHGCEFLADLNNKLSEAEIFNFLESIEDKVTRGLALYGLAEAKRVESLITDFSPKKLGRHLNTSHKAEVNYFFDSKNQAIALSDEEKLDYLFDKRTKLEEHSGYYHASTLENDTLQHLTKKHEGVFGTSITGAGFGGNNIAVVRSSKANALREYLISKYYKAQKPNENFQLLHISKSNDGVSLL